MMFKGNSGFKVEYGQNGDLRYVLKSSPVPDLAARLNRQMKKQMAQRNEMRLPGNVRIPYAEPRGNGTWAVSRVHGQNIFELTDAQRGPAFQQVLGLVGRYVVQSDLVAMLPKIWRDKCSIMMATCSKNHRGFDPKVAAEAQALIKSVSDRLCAKKTRMLLGPCHGDLTFGNMLWDGEGFLWVFDFLDTFLEAPIMDLVKLRQDTLCNWSWARWLKPDGTEPIPGWVADLDQELMTYVRRRSWAREWFPELSALNLARVFQYSPNQLELEHLLARAKEELAMRL